MSLLKETVIKGTAELGVEPSASALEAFETYFHYLEEKNKVMNLTAISGETDVATLHFLDCIALLSELDVKGKKVIDIGSGAGFPGMPMKIMEKEMDLTMLDAQQKRVTFLSSLAEKTGFSDVKCKKGGEI